MATGSCLGDHCLILILGMQSACGSILTCKNSSSWSGNSAVVLCLVTKVFDTSRQLCSVRCTCNSSQLLSISISINVIINNGMTNDDMLTLRHLSDNTRWVHVIGGDTQGPREGEVD